MAAHRRFQAGSLIYEQDTRIHQLHIITRGLVKLYHLMANGERQIIGFLGPGDLLGGIKRKDNAFCSAMAVTEVEACSFDRPRFTEFVHAHPDLCVTLLVVASDEIEALYEHSILLARKKATERVAAFLMAFAARWPSVDEEADSEAMIMRMAIPRSDIADYLGLTNETISRVLARLKQEGLIEFRGPKTIVLKNIPALTYLAGIEEHPRPRMALGL